MREVQKQGNDGVQRRINVCVKPDGEAVGNGSKEQGETNGSGPRERSRECVKGKQEWNCSPGTKAGW